MATSAAEGGDTAPSEFKRRLFTPQEIDQIAKYLVAHQRRQRENIIIPRTFTPTVMKSREEKTVEAIFESCPFKAVLSLVAGMLGWPVLLFFFSFFLGYIRIANRSGN